MAIASTLPSSGWLRFSSAKWRSKPLLVSCRPGKRRDELLAELVELRNLIKALKRE